MKLRKRFTFFAVALLVSGAGLATYCYGSDCGFGDDCPTFKPPCYRVTFKDVKPCNPENPNINGTYMLSHYLDGCMWKDPGYIWIDALGDDDRCEVHFGPGPYVFAGEGPFPSGSCENINTKQYCGGPIAYYGGTAKYEPIWDCEACDLCDDLTIYVYPENYAEIDYLCSNPDCCPLKKFKYYISLSCSGAQYVIPDCSSSDPNIADVTSDPSQCSLGSSVKFIIMPGEGRPLGSATVTCTATFYTESGDVASETVTITVEPEQHECCRDSRCSSVSGGGFSGGSYGVYSLGSASVGNTSIFVIAGTDPVEEFSSVTVLDYNDGQPDIAVKPPGRTQSYIVGGLAMPGWSASIDDSNTVMVTSPEGLKYIYYEDCDYILTEIKNLNDANIVTFDYNDVDGWIDKQTDACNPNFSIEYDYNDTTDLLVTLTAWDHDDPRAYTIDYDDANRAIAMSGCESCGGMGFKYEYDANGLLQRVYDANDDVIYEYAYDSSSRVTDIYLGDASDNNHLREYVYTDNYDGSNIADIYDYIDPNNYRVTREHRNSAGIVTKQIKYKQLNEDPDDYTAKPFIEHTVYYYDPNNNITKNVVIPPLGDSNDPDLDSISGIRKEYTYDPNTGKLLTEKWFDTNDVNLTVASYTYEYIMTPDGNDILDVRVKTYTDARGAVTEYSYDGNDVVPKQTIMPEVSEGISGTQQLKYEYEYDNQNRITLEKQLDYLDNIIVQTKYEYDNYGNLVKRYDDYGDSNEITEYEYNGFNETVKMTLPSGVVQGWSYNESGKVEYKVIYDPCDPNKAYSQTKYYYDINGRVKEIAKADDPNVFVINSPSKWIWTKHQYDLQGNRTKVVEDVNGLELKTIHEYNNQSEVVKVTLPNGKWAKTIRDGRGLVAYTQQGHGDTIEATIRFEYDGNGNRIEQIAPDGTRTSYEHDDYDRPVKVTRGL